MSAPRNGHDRGARPPAADGAAARAGSGRVVRVAVPCSLEYRDVAVQAVAGACRLVRGAANGGGRPDPEFEAHVVSSFNEAFSNAVLHGDGAGGEDLEIEIETHPGRLTVRLKDRGEAFDFEAVPAPALHTLPESGMGIHVMKSWMDDVAYQPGDPNVLSMTKRVGGFTRVDDGEETVLRIDGVLDAVTAPDLRPTIEALVAERRRSITIDLSTLRLIDSSGVGVIVSLFKRSNAFGGTVRVSGLKDQPLQIFKLLRLDRIFAIR